jgi:hypothetical protein
LAEEVRREDEEGGGGPLLLEAPIKWKGSLSMVAFIVNDSKQDPRISSIVFDFIYVSRCCNVVVHILARPVGESCNSIWFHEARASLCDDLLIH